MKKLVNNILSAFVVLFSSAIMTSCLPEDDGLTDLTQKQREKWVNIAADDYYGYLNFSNEGVATTNFVIKNDSSFVCNDFPVTILESAVNKEPAKTIFSLCRKQVLNAEIHPFYGAYNNDYSYYLFPKTASLDFTTTFDGVEYPVSITFATTAFDGNNVVYPIALKNILSEILDANILIESIKVNKQKFDVYKPIALKGYPKSRYKIEQGTK